jgi:hypothetical protein
MRAERRVRRSPRKEEALQLLLGAVRRRSAITSIAIVDSRGFVVAGDGPERELFVLGSIAGPASRGALDDACARMIADTDVLSCPMQIGERRLYLAALGERVTRMPEAARGVARILSAS